ncbi:MAG: hypothetical protein LBP79_06955 [Clostridiales bacterium]|jgi:1-acyl-sn-glycerol-3-phosphate acyltransferase|nr:hypothetical protein [Clostridiales bacterium]
MKKYYSPLKPYSRVPRPHILFNAAFAVARLFVKPNVLLSEALPDEPVIFMANHAFDYGPRAMVFAGKRIKRKFRTWSSFNTLSIKRAPNQMMKTTYPNVKKPWRYLARLSTYIVAPVLGLVFRAAGVIPVYRDMRIKTTYTKTFESLRTGYDVVIFPDSIIPDPENEFVDKTQKGAFKTFEMCRRFLGRAPKLYPVYCCKSLNTVSVGRPLTFDTEIPASEAEVKLEAEFREEMKRLGQALPPHKIIHAASIPKDYDSVKKYLTYNEEKMYAELNRPKETEEAESAVK